ncbi:MAG: nucleotide sugar dehydrogenase [Planctomycetota bacterium]
MTPSDSARQLEQRLTDRSATIAVVGLGYVGLPLVRAMHSAGFRVQGFDTDVQKIRQLQRGETYLHHLGTELVTELAASDRFTPTARAEDLGEADVIILCVPTPLGAHNEPDMTYIASSTRMVAGVLRPGQLVTLESTTYPGTTRGDCLPILASTGLECGTDFFLAYSPEREDPGREGTSTKTIPKLVGGIDDTSGRLAEQLYRAGVDQIVRVESAEVAEAAKLLENIYRAVNIALVNELKPVLSTMGIDIWRVIDAAATKPFGYQAFYPGPGLGGHCIPIDPFYLTWKAREFGHHTRFIELAGEINSSMPRYVVQRTAFGLNQCGKPLRGADLLVIGIAYKPDVDDVRETPAAEIIELLLEQEAKVSYHDPHVPHLSGMRKYDLSIDSVDLTAERLRECDAVVIVTDHKLVDWNLIAREADLIIDTRDAMTACPEIKGRVVKA